MVMCTNLVRVKLKVNKPVWYKFTLCLAAHTIFITVGFSLDPFIVLTSSTIRLMDLWPTFIINSKEKSRPFLPDTKAGAICPFQGAN